MTRPSVVPLKKRILMLAFVALTFFFVSVPGTSVSARRSAACGWYEMTTYYNNAAHSMVCGRIIHYCDGETAVIGSTSAFYVIDTCECAE